MGHSSLAAQLVSGNTLLCESVLTGEITSRVPRFIEVLTRYVEYLKIKAQHIEEDLIASNPNAIARANQFFNSKEGRLLGDFDAQLAPAIANYTAAAEMLAEVAKKSRSSNQLEEFRTALEFLNSETAVLLRNIEVYLMPTLSSMIFSDSKTLLLEITYSTSNPTPFFVSRLADMYETFLQTLPDIDYEVIQRESDTVAGIEGLKSAIIQIRLRSGSGSLFFLESGEHRILFRDSQFNIQRSAKGASTPRTNYALVKVYPDPSTQDSPQSSVDRLIDWDKVTTNYIRSSGPGGQNVNKVSSAVQLIYEIPGTHRKTVVKIDTLRSQDANYRIAERVLIAKVKAHFEEAERELRSSKKKMLQTTDTKYVRTFDFLNSPSAARDLLSGSIGTDLTLKALDAFEEWMIQQQSLSLK